VSLGPFLDLFITFIGGRREVAEEGEVALAVGDLEVVLRRRRHAEEVHVVEQAVGFDEAVRHGHAVGHSMSCPSP
jgi:hypothetical protein